MPESQLSRFALACLLISSTAAALRAETFDLTEASAEVEITTATTNAGIRLTEGSYATALGDLNDDNELDLVIGAAGRNDEMTPVTGAAYVLYGPLSSSPLDLASGGADLVVTGGAGSDRLGYAVAVGDLTDDGHDDLVVVSELHDGPSGSRSDAGAVYVFFGPISGSSLDVANADVTIHGADAGDRLAQAVAIGDISGDDQPDLVVATRYSDGAANAHGTETGEAHLFFSPLSAGTIDLGSTGADAVIYGKDGDNFGMSLAIGDLTDDGDGDLAIGAIWANRTTFGTGEVQVVYGPIAGSASIDLHTTSPDFRLIGTSAFDFMGYDVAIGDLNDDGDADLVGVAGLADNGLLEDVGGAFVEFGPLSGSSKAAASADVQVLLPDSTGETGIANSVTIGDLSFDGIPDLVIGAYFSSGPDDNRDVSGEVDVIYGPLAQGDVFDLQVEAAHQVYYGIVSSKLGGDVLVGDLTGDDVNDLVAIAHFAESADGSAGETYVFSGLRCHFDNFNDGTLQSAWTLVGFGDAGTTNATEANGVLDLQGDGTGFAGASDNAVYLYRNGIAGDFRVETTIVGVPENQGGTFRRGGIWLRSTDTPPFGYTAEQAPNLSVTYSPVYNDGSGVKPQLRFRYRANWGSNPDSSFASPILQAVGNTFNLPVRIAIERRNGDFGVFYFKNMGRPRWAQVKGGLVGLSGWAALSNLGTAPSIGLVTTSNHASTTATFRYDDYTACRP